MFLIADLLYSINIS